MAVTGVQTCALPISSVQTYLHSLMECLPGEGSHKTEDVVKIVPVVTGFAGTQTVHPLTGYAVTTGIVHDTFLHILTGNVSDTVMGHVGRGLALFLA